MTATAWTVAPCGCCRVRVHTAPRSSFRGQPGRRKHARYAYLIESDDEFPDFMSRYQYHQVSAARAAGLADIASLHELDGGESE
jgi:hypothetical protein